MKYKIMILMLLFSSLALGAVLDLSETDMVGDIIVKDNVTYRVVYSTETFFDGHSMKRIFVENLDTTTELQAIESDILSVRQKKENKLIELEDTISEIEFNIVNSMALVEFLKTQKNLSMTNFAMLQDETEEIENMITSNLLVSPTTYNTGIVVFVILLVIVIIISGRKAIKLGQGKKKSDKKSPEKKKDLEIVADEIKKKPGSLMDTE